MDLQKSNLWLLIQKKGLVIITGCAHPGIVNIVKRTEELMKRDKVYLVLGGFHHPPLSCVKEFKELGVEKVAPSHCTGDLAREAFRKEYKENFIEYGVGKIIEIKWNEIHQFTLRLTADKRLTALRLFAQIPCLRVGLRLSAYARRSPSVRQKIFVII